METQEWTVKQLIEALKKFPPEAKVFYEMGPSGAGTVGKAQYVRAGVRMMSWECCLTGRFARRQLADAVYRWAALVSTASAAESFRSRCGSVRGAPV